MTFSMMFVNRLFELVLILKNCKTYLFFKVFGDGKMESRKCWLFNFSVSFIISSVIIFSTRNVDF